MNYASAALLATFFATASPLAAQTVDPTPTPAPATPTSGNPTDSDTPALRNRLFSADTSSYDVKLPLGRFAIVDRDKKIVTEFLEKGRFACDPKIALQTATSAPLKPTIATQQVVDEKYEGSLSIFVVDAKLSSTEREELTVTDIATADVTNACELSRQKILEIARSLPGSEGLDVIWVSGVTLSNLNMRKYSKVEGGISGGGSWLSIGVDGYKGAEKIDAVPIFALRGYIVKVPKKGSSTLSTSIDGVKRFATLQEIGITSYRAVRSKAQVPQ